MNTKSINLCPNKRKWIPYTNLHDNATSLSLCNSFVLFQMEVQVMTVAVLQHRAKTVGVDLKNVEQIDNSGMLQCLVYVVLTQGVLDIVGLLVVLPIFVQLMYLAGNIALFFQVESLMNLNKSIKY